MAAHATNEDCEIYHTERTDVFVPEHLGDQLEKANKAGESQETFPQATTPTACCRRYYCL